MDESRRRLWLMLAATFATGIVDAVGYLGLDRVFTGNMTGNVVILGMALTGANDLPVVGPALALLGFLAGAVIGGRALRGRGPGWGRRMTALFAGAGMVMLAAGAVLVAAGGPPPQALGIALTTGLGLAMGLQASAARHLGVKDVTTVVVTSTITGLAADSRLAGGTGAGGPRRLLAVGLILAGAAAGAGLLQWQLAAGPVLAGVIVLTVATLGAVGIPHGPPEADLLRKGVAGCP